MIKLLYKKKCLNQIGIFSHIYHVYTKLEIIQKQIFLRSRAYKTCDHQNTRLKTKS